MFEIDRQMLKKLRKKNRYTLAEAGKVIGGHSYNKLWAIENGKTKYLKAVDLFELSELYGVDPVELAIKK